MLLNIMRWIINQALAKKPFFWEPEISEFRSIQFIALDAFPEHARHISGFEAIKLALFELNHSATFQSSASISSSFVGM